MNKVTSYLKNIGKSIGYASVDISKGLIPEVTDFVETNEEILKSIYTTVSHSKESIRLGKKLAKESQLYKDINKGINNVFEDIKTGNLYNKERSQSMIDKAGESLAGGFGDFGDDDFNLDDFGDDDEDFSFDDENDNSSTSITKGDLFVADSVSRSGNASAQLISNTVANSSTAIIKSNITSAGIIAGQTAQIMAGVRTSIAGVHASINEILKFINDDFKTQISNQVTYFETTTNLMQENNAILKEMLEMQRNIYKSELEKSKSKDQFSDVFLGGSIDIKEYMKAVFKNVKGLDKTGTVDMIIGGNGEGGINFLEQMLSNPLGEVVKGLISSQIPKSLAASITSFSKTLGNIMPIMISRLNKWKNDDLGFKSLLGQIFGLSTDTKTTIDTSKYNKSTVPFDGITRKAIVDIIPEHLSRIESILEGKSQRSYDYKTGKWIDVSEIKKKFEEEYADTISNSFNEYKSDYRNYIEGLKNQKSLSAEDMKSLDKDFAVMMKKVYEDYNGYFSPEDIKRKKEFFGFSSSEELIDGLLEAFSRVPKTKRGEVARSTLENKRRYGDKLREYEESGSVYNKLFDNSRINSHLKYDSTYNDVITNVDSNNIINIRDKLGLNTLDYLRDISVNLKMVKDMISFNNDTNNYPRKKSKKYIAKKDRVKLKSFDDYINEYRNNNIQKEIKAAKEKQDKDDSIHNELYYDDNVDVNKSILGAIFNTITNTSSVEEDLEGFKKDENFYKKSKYNKEVSKIPGKTTLEKFKNAPDIKSKLVVMRDSIFNFTRKPAEYLTGIITKAEESIYDWLFTAETDEFDEETKKPIMGHMRELLYKFNGYASTLLSTFTEKVIDPITKKLGLGDKWDKLKEKVADTSIGQSLKNFKDKVFSSLKDDIGGIGSYVKSSLQEAADPIINDHLVANARLSFINKQIERAKKGLDKVSIGTLYNITKEKKETEEKELLNKRQEIYNKNKSIFNEKDKEQLRSLGVNVDSLAIGGIGKIITMNKGGKDSSDINRDNNRIPVLEKKVNDKNLRVGIHNDQEVQYVANLADEKSTEENKKKEEAAAKKLKKYLKLKDKKEKIIKNKKDKNDIDIMYIAMAQEVKNRVDNFLGSKKDEEKDKNTLLSKVTGVLGELQGSEADLISKSILGGGIGLLSGIIGGPLIGAGIGAALSLTKNSTTISKFLFGERTIDEKSGLITDQKGGLIKKNIQNTFRKYLPDAGKYGVAGTVLSLATPFGPLTGAALGAGIGIVKNSDTLNKMVFGDIIGTDENGKAIRDNSGLLTPARIKKIKEAFPGASVGAIGGLFLGPFGLLGNAALGAGVGLLAGSEDFKSLIFGEKDADGKRHGGISEALKINFVNPLKDFGDNFKEDFFDFIQESMIDPLNRAITPIASEIAYQTKKVVFGIPKMFTKVVLGIPKMFTKLGKDYIAEPLIDLLGDRVVDPLSKLTKNIFGKMFNTAKGVVSLPFRTVGAIGDTLRKKQIRQGRDKVGTAKSRIQFAKQNKMGNYKYREFDETLAENSDNEEFLQEVTARTGMLAHGAEHFEKEVKNARKELSKVLSKYYKLGWFSKDKAGYKRIRQYIKDNDIDSAIQELTNIQKSRSTGGRLDDKEANEAISEFTSVNEKYQIAKQAREKFGNINKEENEQWMRDTFGDKWKEMDAKKLFEYSTKELSSFNGKNISKADLFAADSGARLVNTTLEKMTNILEDIRKGIWMEPADKEKYDAGVKSGIEKSVQTRNNRKDIIKSNLLEKGFKINDDNEIIDKLYANDDILDLVLYVASKGFVYDVENIKILCDMDLSKEDIKTIKHMPYLGKLPKDILEKFLSSTRNNHAAIFNNGLFGSKKIKNKNLKLLNEALSNGVEIKDLKDANMITSGGLHDSSTYDHSNRNKYYKELNKLGLIGKIVEVDGKSRELTKEMILSNKGLSYSQLDKIISEAGGESPVKEKTSITSRIYNSSTKILKGAGLIKDKVMNIGSGLLSAPKTLMNLTKSNNKEDNIRYESSEYGTKRYKKIKDEWQLDMSDSETQETLQREKDGQIKKNSFFENMTSMKDGILGIFNRGKKKDEEEKKEPLLKRLFNFDLSGIKSKLGFGAAILGLVTGIGTLKKVWDNEGSDGIMHRLANAIGDKIKPIGDWFMNTGDYASSDQGLQGFLSNHLFPNFFNGINLIFEKVIPAFLKAFIVSMPSLIKAGISGIGELLGFGKNKNKNDNKLSANNITSASSGQNVTIDTGSSLSSNTSTQWAQDVSSQAKQIADNLINQSNSVTTSTTNTATNENEYVGFSNAVDMNKFRKLQNGETTVSETINTAASNAKSTINNSISNTSNTVEDNPQAVIGGTVYMYNKDENGNLIPITVSQVKQGTVNDFYTEQGAHYIYNENTGDYESESGDTSTDKKGLPSRLAGVTVKSALTQRNMGIMRTGQKLLNNKVTGTVLKGTDKVLSKTPIVKKFYNGLIKPFAKGTGKLSTIGTNFGKNASTYGKYITDAVTEGFTASSAIKEVSEDIVSSSKLGKAITEKFSKSSEILTKVTSWVKSGLTKIFGNSFIKEKIGKALVEKTGKEASESVITKTINSIIEKLMKTFTQKIANSAGGKFISKIAVKIGAGSATAGLATIAFIVKDLVVGYNQAESILGVSDASLLEKLIASITNVITNELFFGLVDASTVVNWCVDIIMPFFNIDTSDFKARQEETDREVEEYNKQNGTNYSTEEYLKKDKWTYKLSKGIGNAASNLWNGTKNFASNVWEGAKNIGSGIVNGASNVWNGTKNLATKAWDSTKNLATKAWNRTAIANMANDNLIRQKLGLNEDVNVTMQDRLVSGAGSIVSNLSLGLFKDEDVTKAINGGVEMLKEGITTGIDNANKGIGALLGLQDENGNPLSLSEGVKQGYDKTVKALSKGWNNFKASVSDLWDNTKEITSQTINNIKSGISSGLDSANRGIGALLGLQDENGNPLSLTEGISEGYQNTVKVLSDGWNNFKSGASNMWTSINEKASNFFESASESIGKGLDNLNNNIGAFLGLEDENGNPLSLTEGIKKTTSNVAKSFADGWNNFKESTKGFFGGISNWFTNTADSLINKSNETVAQRNAGKGSGKLGFISQIDPRYSNMNFNKPGDTEVQTIADSGCAPATAANVLNLYSGKGVMENASQEALKYKDTNGGVTPDYFQNYLGKNGINTNSTMNKNEMMNSISSGRPTILLGSDPTNKANTPYGSASSHYVLATGTDGRGNAIVQDPESRRPNVLYPMKDLIKQSHLGMVTGKGSGKTSFMNKLKAKLGGVGFGRGKYGSDTIEYKVWNSLRAAGYNEIATAAAMGNIKHESGFNPSMIEKGSGAGFGLIQWTGGRRTALENFAKNKGKQASDLGVQIEYLLIELNNDTKAWMNASSKYGFGSLTRNDWANGTSLDKATKAFMCCFERPSYNSSINHIDRRLASAKEYYEEFTGTQIDENLSLDISSSSNSSSSSSSSNNIFDMLADLPKAYFGEGIMKLFGLSSSTSSSDSDTSYTNGGSTPADNQKVESAISQMEQWANDSNTGYDQEYRWGQRGDYDCSSAVISAYEKAGIPVKTNGATYTGNMYDVFTKTGFKDVTSQVNLSNGGGLQRGDVLLNKANHTAMYSGDGKQVDARINENGGTKGGKPGDQTGEEFLIRNYRNYPWDNVLRYTGQGSGKSKNSSTMTGKGTNLASSILDSLTRNRQTPTDYNTLPSIDIDYSGKGVSMPSLETNDSKTTTIIKTNEVQTSNKDNSNTDRLLSVIIEVLKIIADNSGKLSEIVTLLSKSLDVELTTNDISKLSSNNAQIKNKIANALKVQGSKTGMGSSVMNADTQSLASAMYAIARA